MRDVTVGQIVSNLFLIGIAGLFVLALGYLGLQVGDRSLPVVLLDTPVLETPTVRAGEDSRVRIKFVVLKYCPTHVDTFLFDSSDALKRQESKDYESGQAEPNKPDEVVIPIPVPIDFPGGRTTFRAITTYRCNWVQSWWPLHAPPFEIVWNTVAVPPEEMQQRVSEELKQLLLEKPK